MQKSDLAMLVGGLLLGATGAMAQQLAAAVPPPKGAFIVFAERDGHVLSPTALSTLRIAAGEERAPLAKTADGLSDPNDRRVEIKF